MRVVFVSNFMNHHQKPLCDSFAALPDVEVYFIATESVPEDRKKLGYHDSFELDYYVDAQKQPDRATELCRSADVLIIGSAPFRYLRHPKNKHRQVFFYSERLFKEKQFCFKWILRAAKYLLRAPTYRNGHLLCSSAYAAGDYQKLGLFRGRALKWGYFPETKQYDSLETLLSQKKPHSLLWAGRFIDWKHPEAAVEIAKRLKRDGLEFSLTMVGTGNMFDDIKQKIEQEGLTKEITLLGAVSPEQVREQMEQSEILLFTSDTNEGWGAVLNEAMNSACVPVANDEIGSAPYMVVSGENGLLFHAGDSDEFYQQVKRLFLNSDLCRQMANNAYETIQCLWNSDRAAAQLVAFVKQNEDSYDIPSNGPCSQA